MKVFVAWIEAAIAHRKVTDPAFCQSELARRLASDLGRGIDRSTINKILKGRRDLLADEMIAIARVTGYPILPAGDFAASLIRERSRPCVQDPQTTFQPAAR